MTPLGKSLVFYFKYPAEMERLYWRPRRTGKKPDIGGLAVKSDVLAMIQKVGDAACSEAAAFLEACAERLESHFRSVARSQRSRRILERSWGLLWRLSPKRSSEKPFEAGAYIDETIRAIVPWVWCRGGRRGEDEVVRVLGRGIKASSSGFLFESGTVALARVDVPVSDVRSDFDVQREPLVEQVVSALAFNAREVKALSQIAMGRD